MHLLSDGRVDFREVGTGRGSLSSSFRIKPLHEVSFDSIRSEDGAMDHLLDTDSDEIREETSKDTECC